MTTNDTLEKTVDVAEEVLETLERIPKAHLNGTTKVQQIVILSAVAAGGALIGATVSHILTKRKADKMFAAAVLEEVEKAKEFYARAHKVDLDGNPLSPQEMFKEYISEPAEKEPVSEYDTRSNSIDPASLISDRHVISEPVLTQDGDEGKVASPEELQNVWDGHEPSEEDEEALLHEVMSIRDAGKPYILSHDEFYTNEFDFEQDELTYFEGGRQAVLVDTQSIPVGDVENTVGELNLNRIGLGSKNANVLFVRNERLKTDFEITRSPNSYAQDVLGIDDSDGETEIRHSNRRTRKFRDSDE